MAFPNVACEDVFLMFFDDPTFVNWLSWWSSNYTIQHLRWCVMIRHLWWFALSTFHEESARAVSTWYLQAGALNPEARRRTNGPTMACFGRDQVLRIIKLCLLIIRHIYTLSYWMSPGVSRGQWAFRTAIHVSPDDSVSWMFSGKFLKVELQNLRLRWSHNIPCFIPD